MDIRKVREKHSKFIELYGADAPVAMLAWLNQATLADDQQAQRLAAVVQKLLVNRCLDVWRAQRDREDVVAAYEKAATELWHVLARAQLLQDMQEPEV